MSRGDQRGAAGPAVDDVQPDGEPGGAPDAPRAAALVDYHDTAVGRLPVGPAADAALAGAAAGGPAARRARERRAAEALDLGAASRGAVLKRLVTALAAAFAAVLAIAVWRRTSS